MNSFAKLAPNLYRIEKRVSFLGGYYRNWEKALQEALRLRLFFLAGSFLLAHVYLVLS